MTHKFHKFPEQKFFKVHLNVSSPNTIRWIFCACFIVYICHWNNIYFSTSFFTLFSCFLSAICPSTKQIDKKDQIKNNCHFLCLYNTLSNILIVRINVNFIRFMSSTLIRNNLYVVDGHQPKWKKWMLPVEDKPRKCYIYQPYIHFCFIFSISMLYFFFLSHTYSIRVEGRFFSASIYLTPLSIFSIFQESFDFISSDIVAYVRYRCWCCCYSCFNLL